MVIIRQYMKKTMNTESIDKISIAKKYASRIQHWDDERKMGNSLIVTLTGGWRFDYDTENPNATHVMGFDTLKDAKNSVRESVPCACIACSNLVQDEVQ